MKKIEKIKKFFNTDIKIFNSYILIAIILIILTIVGYISYAYFTYESETSDMLSLRITVGDKTFNQQDNYQIYTVPVTGYYQIEAWGAQGGNDSTGGKGGYTKGRILLTAGEKLYVYVGGKGQFTSTSTSGVSYAGGYNGGGAAFSQDCCGRTWGSGGGATDIRYFGSTTPTAAQLVWNSDLGLRSRIMVAGAGGGCYYPSADTSLCDNGGASNGLTGNNGANADYTDYSPGVGATQTSGGAIVNTGQCDSTPGYFGIGGAQTAAQGSSGGGGGYYGGGGSCHVASAAGGSSYISGYQGSVAIVGTGSNPLNLRSVNGTQCTAASAANNIECSYHYSDKIFTNTVMQGARNTGNGKVIIKYKVLGGESSTPAECTVTGPYTGSDFGTSMIYTKEGGGSGYNPYYRLSCDAVSGDISDYMSAADLKSSITTTSGLTVSNVNLTTDTSSNKVYTIETTPTAGTYGNKNIVIPDNVIINSTGGTSQTVTSSSVKVIYVVTGAWGGPFSSGSPYYVAGSTYLFCGTGPYQINTTSGYISFGAGFVINNGDGSYNYNSSDYYGCVGGSCACFYSGTFAEYESHGNPVQLGMGLPASGSSYSCSISRNNGDWGTGTGGVVLTVYN